ncbi:hypothetical protein HDU93_001745 [Gonapodya sp. JEL0774]|nr:hypothetical protein HDU93_001745 [Gonapodya sp. JEL0774]
MWTFRRVVSRLRLRGRGQPSRDITSANAEGPESSVSTTSTASSPTSTPTRQSSLSPKTTLHDLPPEILLLIAAYLPLNPTYRLGSPFPEMDKTLREKLHDPSSIASRAIKKYGSVQSSFCAELTRPTLDPFVLRALWNEHLAREVEPREHAESDSLSLSLFELAPGDIVARFASWTEDSSMGRATVLARAACKGGHLEVVRALYALEGAREFLVSDSYCMVNAALSGNPDLMRFLVESGGDIYVDEQAALLAIAQVGTSARCLDVLLAADAHHRRFDISRALQLSAYSDNERIFLKLYASLADRKETYFVSDPDGAVLHFCASKGLEDPARSIVAVSTPRAKATALLTAARRGHVTIVRVLLQQGDIPRRAAQNALAVARASGEEECAQELVAVVNGLAKAAEPGGDSHGDDIEESDQSGTPYFLRPLIARSVRIRSFVDSSDEASRDGQSDSGDSPVVAYIPATSSSTLSPPPRDHQTDTPRSSRWSGVPWNWTFGGRTSRESRHDGTQRSERMIRRWANRTFRPLSQLLRRAMNRRRDDSSTGNQEEEPGSRGSWFGSLRSR